MRKTKIISILALVMCFTFAFVACQPAQKADTLKSALVTDVGGVNDRSFNQSAWEGLQRVEKDLGFTVGYLESKQEDNYKPNLETLNDQDNNLIWGIGFMMGGAVEEAAKANPDKKYACVDFGYENAPENLLGVLFKEEEPGYLAGYIAGKMSKTNKVGFVGGIPVPAVVRYQFGFMAGAKKANPNIEVVVQYANSFVDVALGKSIATQMYQDNCDIVFPAAGAVGIGCIDAAKELNKWIIGVDVDQNYLAPDNVITSAMKNVNEAVYLVCKSVKDGTFKGGNNVYSLKDGAVGIAPTSDKHVPKEILDEVKQIEKDIIDGKIKVPTSEEEYNALVGK